MHVLCIFSTNLTLGVRNKDLRSRKPVVVPTECPPTQNHGPTEPQTESPRTATGHNLISTTLTAFTQHVSFHQITNIASYPQPGYPGPHYVQ